MFNAVIYRHNPTLAARVAQAKPDFVHEFPAEMSVEDIKQALGAVVESLCQILQSTNSRGGFTVHVDSTVMAAGIGFAEKDMRFIRQDGEGAYDWYASQIAEAAKSCNRVVLVRERIADHNTEGVSLEAIYDFYTRMNDAVYRAEREDLVVQNWTKRLVDRGVSHEIIDIDTAREANLVGALVVCDHHNGWRLMERWKSEGVVWFNSYPPCHEDDFLSA